MSSADFGLRVQLYCHLLEGSVTSWGRSVAHNAVVGGVPQSAHLYWLAVDVTYDGPRNLALALDTARRLGLLLIHEADHDHLQPIDWRAG
jgi:hypothetical protein